MRHLLRRLSASEKWLRARLFPELLLAPLLTPADADLVTLGPPNASLAAPLAPSDSFVCRFLATAFLHFAVLASVGSGSSPAAEKAVSSVRGVLVPASYFLACSVSLLALINVALGRVVQSGVAGARPEALVQWGLWAAQWACFVAACVWLRGVGQAKPSAGEQTRQDEKKGTVFESRLVRASFFALGAVGVYVALDQALFKVSWRYEIRAFLPGGALVPMPQLGHGIAAACAVAIVASWAGLKRSPRWHQAWHARTRIGFQQVGPLLAFSVVAPDWFYLTLDHELIAVDRAPVLLGALLVAALTVTLVRFLPESHKGGLRWLGALGVVSSIALCCFPDGASQVLAGRLQRTGVELLCTVELDRLVRAAPNPGGRSEVGGEGLLLSFPRWQVAGVLVQQGAVAAVVQRAAQSSERGLSGARVSPCIDLKRVTLVECRRGLESVGICDPSLCVWDAERRVLAEFSFPLKDVYGVRETHAARVIAHVPSQVVGLWRGTASVSAFGVTSYGSSLYCNEVRGGSDQECRWVAELDTSLRGLSTATLVRPEASWLLAQPVDIDATRQRALVAISGVPLMPSLVFLVEKDTWSLVGWGYGVWRLSRS